MGISLRNAAVWQTPPAGRLQYIRVGGVWKPILDMWVMGNPAAGAAAVPANTFLDPFNNVSAWTGGGASVAGGRTGNGFQATSNSVGQGGALHALTAPQQGDTVTVGFAFKVTSLTGDNNVLSFWGDAGATLHTSVQLGNTRNIYAYRGPSTVLGSNSSGSAYPAAGSWFYVEVQVRLHDTLGSVVVRINGVVVLNLTNQDTKNGGTGTVIDQVQLSSGSTFNGGIVDDFYLTPGAAFLGDLGDVSNPPTSPPASTDHSWHKEPTYSAPQLVSPTNLRMNPADPNSHTSFAVAWDYALPAGGLPPSNYHLVLTNEAGTWLQDLSVPYGTQTYSFTGLNQNTRYRVYVAARYAGGGRPDTAWLGPLNWQLGADAYVVNDVPVYGWGPEFEWMPSFSNNFTSSALNDPATWGFQKAFDNDFTSFWNTDVVPESYGATQGEGFTVQPPGGHYLFTGMRLWTIYPHTVWLGVYDTSTSAWQGGSVVYTGKYTSYRHNYLAGVDGSQPTSSANPTVRGGNFVTDNNVNGLFIAGLLQYPHTDGFNPRITVIELRLLLQPWQIDHYNPRTVPAVPSAAY